MAVGRMQITLGEHGGPRKTRQDSSSLGSAARRLTLSRYVARLKPRCGSLALSVMCGIHSKSYKVSLEARNLGTL
eukprot:scaffold42866_cov35-Phaeocystis_antarctica.AAC.2